MSTARPHLSQTNEAAPKGVIQRLRHRLGNADRSTVLSTTVVAYIFLASVAWAMITPIGGVPDEPAHITYSAAVVRGDLGAMAVVNHPVYPQLAVVTVPEWVGEITDPPRSIDAFPYPCYGGGVTITADCAPQLSTSTTPTRVPTTVNRYPPPYYWIVGLPTLVMAGEPAIYAMRIMSAALAAAVIAMGLTIASPARRTWLALGTMVAATPMVTHLAGSVNPSGLEIASALGLGIGLMGVVGTEKRRPGVSAVLMVALAFLVAWARPNTHLTLIAVVGASILINARGLLGWLHRRVVGMAAGVGIATAIWSALALRTVATRLTDVVAPSPPVESILSAPILDLNGNLQQLEQRFIDWGTDLIGRFGWLDHSPPVAITVAWLLAVMVLVMVALVLAPRREGATLFAVIAGAIVVAPLFVITKTLNAFVYQARYHLPLATLIVIGAIVMLGRLQIREDRQLGWSILRRVALLAPAATVLTILGSLHRYSVGGDTHITNGLSLPFVTRAWMPPWPAVLVAAAAGVGALLLGKLLAARTASSAGSLTQGAHGLP